jgi:hypothetical protein
MDYTSLGYNGFGIRTISDYRKQTPSETRNSAQPGTIIADGLHESVNNLKIDKDGIYLGTAVPAYEEGRLYYSFTEHALKVAGQTAWEKVTSA